MIDCRTDCWQDRGYHSASGALRLLSELPMADNLGQRIATLRSQQGFTQQELADRLAISRTAVSHLEAGISVPSERTITLLAGLFKLEPAALIAETNYPIAKAERLPLVACWYTEAELVVQLVERDCVWLQRLHTLPEWTQLVHETCQDWFERLAHMRPEDRRERARLAVARAALEELLRAARTTAPATPPEQP